MTGPRRVGATPIAPTEGEAPAPTTGLFNLGNPVWAELDPPGPEFNYANPFLEDAYPPTVLKVDDDTLFSVYGHETDEKPADFSGPNSIYIRKLTYDADLPVPVSALDLPGAGGSANASRTGTQPRGVRFDGQPDSYAEADPDFTWPFGDANDLDIRMLILPDDWTPAVSQTLMSKWEPGQLAFRLKLNTNGRLHFEKVWTDGTTLGGTECTAAVPFVPGQPTWIRVTCFSGYQIKYWVADNPGEEIPNWVQLGSNADAGHAGLNIEASTARLLLGAASGADLATPTNTKNEFSGTIYEAEIWVESSLEFNASFSKRRGPWQGGITTTTLTNRNGDYDLTLYGGTEVRSILDLVDRIELRLYSVSADDWTPSSRTVLVADDNWEFSIEPSGSLQLTIAQDGATPTFISASSSAATGFSDGTTHHLRADWNINDATVQFYTSDPYYAPTWTQLGTDQALSVTGVFDSTGDLRVGSASGDTDQFAGSIGRMDLWLEPRATGEPVELRRAAAPRFNEQVAGTTTFTDGTGDEWVLDGDATIVDVDGSTSEGFVVSEEVLLFGGIRHNTTPPLSDSSLWDVDQHVQIVPVDTEHVLLRMYDESGIWDGDDYGTGNYNRSVGCALVTIDWDTKTVEYGPWNILFQDDDEAYEYTYGDYGLTTRRCVFLPDGRFVAVSTDWNWMSPALRVGTMNYGTGVATLGAVWLHPDYDTDGNWNDIFGGLDLFVIDDTRVAVFWKNFNDVVHTGQAVRVAIFDVENDDTLTLVEWADILMPDDTAEADFESTTEYTSFEQVRPGVFVGAFYMMGGVVPDWYTNLWSINLADITSNELTWTPLYGTPDNDNPVLYRSAAYWDPDNGYPEHVRIIPVNQATGKFILTWQDYTTAVPRPGASEWDYATVELVRGFVMEDDMSFVTSPAILQASLSDLSPDFQERTRWLGGRSAAVHDVACTSTTFSHDDNWWADPMPDPNYYELGTHMVTKYVTAS